jgi:hypothetical protein
LSLQSAIDWRIEAIERLDSVLQGKAETASWDTEDFGSFISRDVVEIFQLHDEDHCVKVSTESFRRALELAIDFLRTEPSSGSVQEIEVE